MTTSLLFIYFVVVKITAKKTTPLRSKVAARVPPDFQGVYFFLCKQQSHLNEVALDPGY
jgi:hypothetical protein